ncbi:NAD-dependent epimerase/dehydratase family protein [Yanshouia hominis]|uniref:NAD-dependent epimerase/dehydratase family protein n=1 Tax=Yanshouia hominis TaxID=2763673 RepID=A0ABR7NM91_9FIRM|nr:NAD-dependent epimerase/dehydratase family protein [Yanshouia hominis]MBC8577485.1 NAD-dependent epimerase/dehydratase family protein [Yanshouia hominis]
MKEILLLGANGFVGKNLKEFFQTDCPQLHLTSPSSRELNLLDEESVRRFLQRKQFDVVIHAAIGNPLRDSFHASVGELEQDLKMFFHLEKYHDLYGRMLYFGSGAEFDKRNGICAVSDLGFVNGVPESSYGLAKYIIGKAIEASANIYNFRIFGLFGKYENWRTTFISGSCCKALKGLPITIRQNVFFDYLYIDDFCRAVGWFIEHETRFHTYNVTSGRRDDLLSIAETVKRLSGADVPIYLCREGLGNEYTASNRRLLEEYPDFAITRLDDAITALLEYYKTILDTIDLYSLLYQN